jgi:alpha-mannosidase
VRRVRHRSGIERLTTVREIDGVGTLTVSVTVAPDVAFVRCDVSLDNRWPDHRFRLRFPTGAPVDNFTAATTFDTAHRTTTRPDDTEWVHDAPGTFVQQGWVSANGLVVGAPGLPEAEVTASGDLLITLVRSVGALAKLEVNTRSLPAGPEMSAPGAQVRGTINATITLATDPRDVHAAEIGMRAVIGDDAAVLAENRPLLTLESERSLLSACKPAEDGDGIVVRVLNPSDDPDQVLVRFGIDVATAQAVLLDETPADDPVAHDKGIISMIVMPHSLRSVRVHTLRR